MVIPINSTTKVFFVLEVHKNFFIKISIQANGGEWRGKRRYEVDVVRGDCYEREDSLSVVVV